jgi:molybdopterin-guanine dinucleotide biosynthesis protein A
MMTRQKVNRSAIILCGGQSKRFGQNKSLSELLGKPLISYVIHEVNDIVDEVLVVVASEEQKKALIKFLSSSIKIVIDEYSIRSPLIGALTGLKAAHGEYSILLPCDSPLLSRKVMSLLFTLVHGLEAVIPKWPNNYIEPLQAVYHTKAAFTASVAVVKKKKMRMKNMIMRLNKLLYLSSTLIQTLDPTFNTFLNINTPEDLKRIEQTLLKKFRINKS